MRTVATIAGALALAGCSTTATVDAKIMDAPPDGVKAVKIWIASMQMHVVDKEKGEGKKGDPADASVDDAPVAKTGEDGAGEPNKWISVTVDKEIDLAAHQGEGAAATLGQLELPEGKITQIRLVVDTEKPGSNLVTKTDDSTCALDMARVAKKGIKINHVFKAFDVEGGAAHEVIVDFDLGESMKTKGSCWELEPKLKLHKVKREGAEVDVKA